MQFQVCMKQSDRGQDCSALIRLSFKTREEGWKSYYNNKFSKKGRVKNKEEVIVRKGSRQ